MTVLTPADSLQKHNAISRVRVELFSYIDVILFRANRFWRRPCVAIPIALLVP